MEISKWHKNIQMECGLFAVSLHILFEIFMCGNQEGDKNFGVKLRTIVFINKAS